MPSLKAKGLPQASTADLRPFVSEGPADEPYRELGNVRLRRAADIVECEVEGDDGLWRHWYMGDVGVVFLGRVTVLARVLARKVPASGAAAFVARNAPRVAAAMRRGVTNVDGTTVGVTHFASSTAAPAPPRPGIDPEEYDSVAAMTAAIPAASRSASVLDERWFEAAAQVGAAGQALVDECGALEHEFDALDAADQQRLLSEPTIAWGTQLSKLANLATGVAELVDAGDKIATIFSERSGDR